jgi:hypothetical protein
MTVPEAAQPGDRHGSGARSRQARLALLALLVLPPLLAFLLAQAVDFAAAAHSGFAAGYLTPGRWTHWDGHLYLAIAAKGYTLQRVCHRATLPPHSYCGTAGWLPLFPGMISLLGRFGVPLPWGGLYIAEVFAAGTMFLVWLLIGPSWSPQSLLALSLAAVFPGQIYFFALFPVSLVAFLALGFLLLMSRRRYLLAGLAAAAAAWAYPIGLLLAPVAAAYTAIADHGRSVAQWLRRALPTVGLASLGILALLLAYQHWVGAWDAFFLVQAKYGNGFHNPVAIFLVSLDGAGHARYAIQDPNPGYKYLPPKAQTVYVAGLVTSLIVSAAAWWRKHLTRTDWAVLCYTAIVWLLPLTQSVAVSRYRSEALLVPCVALVRRFPVPVQAALVAVAAWIAFAMAPLFFAGKLI